MTTGLPDFGEFFEAIYGYPPFPWQRRLATRVVDGGLWPRLLDMPTASGKTAAIDVALYALACRPELLPRRIVLVVNRRVIVDQGADRARRILRALTDASDGVLAQVADRLRATYGGSRSEPPFTIAVLRGGMPRDESWADRPDVPAVVMSTVDQVGSRLLFRGYGVSESMSPVHAGLFGNDCLYLLDEVQLSTAFAQTLDAIATRWRTWHARNGGQRLPDRWQVVAMSATPNDERTGPDGRLTLDDADRSHPVLSRRLAASKPARLREVSAAGPESSRHQAFVSACCDALSGYVTTHGTQVSAVVVNRVATARDIHRVLSTTFGDRAHVHLLTGRMRPLDRERILGRASDPSSLLSAVSVGRRRGGLKVPIVVVATQSIEAGADFDFDALVTECAPLDALRQRFGRLDRAGELGTAPATILVRRDRVGDESDDPVYGPSLAATWRWLQSAAHEGTVDFGVASFPAPPDEILLALSTPSVSSPVLLPTHVDTWAQTNPRPEPEPDVALWLHGPDRGLPEVRVVWRADVDAADLEAVRSAEAVPGRDVNEVTAQWAACLAAVPPSSLEALSVPLPALRAWLDGRHLAPVADVEGTDASDEDVDDEASPRPRRCLLVSAKEVRPIAADELRPGCTVVVPATYGGIAHGNWDPLAAETVTDLGDLAQLVHRGRLVLRLHADVWNRGQGGPDQQWMAAAAAAGVPRPSDEESSGSLRALVADWLDGHVREDGPLGRAVRSAVLPSGPTQKYMRVLDIGGGQLIVVGTRRVSRKFLATDEERIAEAVTEADESGSFSGQDVTLDAHLADVAALAEHFARHLGMPEDVIAAVTCAARWHDIGKCDPRFQQMLAGGSPVRLALQAELLAKSRGESRDRHARELARTRAAYPPGYRHELLSLAMVERGGVVVPAAIDADLAFHLVASHHGWCRPFAPATDVGPAIDVESVVGGLPVRGNTAHTYARVESPVAERYTVLTERYGWWGLAWVEAILRLADHRASAGR